MGQVQWEIIRYFSSIKIFVKEEAGKESFHGLDSILHFTIQFWDGEACSLNVKWVQFNGELPATYLVLKFLWKKKRKG